MATPVPQPSVERMVSPSGKPLVVGVVPGQPDLVVHTAAAWASTLGVPLYFAYADPDRVVEVEYPDGTVRHTDLNPDQADLTWQDVERSLRDFLTAALAGQPVAWEFRYLAGRADRALTHLARAVDASAFVVGGRHPGRGERVREFLAASMSVSLARHQHRPVITVPLAVVDWKTPLP